MTPTEDPADELTITEVTDNFAADGFGGQFAAIEGAMVRCFTCRAERSASLFNMVDEQRTEGASDPDDMVLVVAVECPVCLAPGTLTLKYGPEASPEDQAVIRLLGDKR